MHLFGGQSKKMAGPEGVDKEESGGKKCWRKMESECWHQEKAGGVLTLGAGHYTIS